MFSKTKLLIPLNVLSVRFLVSLKKLKPDSSTLNVLSTSYNNNMISNGFELEVFREAMETEVSHFNWTFFN